MNRPPRPGLMGLASWRLRRPPERRRSLNLRPWLQGLEDRIVPASISWNTAVAASGGNWDVGTNWVGGNVPSSSDDAVINLTSAGNVTLSSNQNDAVHSLSTNANTTLSVSS